MKVMMSEEILFRGFDRLNESAAAAGQALTELREAYTILTVTRDRRPLELRMRRELIRMWEEQERRVQRELLPQLTEATEELSEALRDLSPAQLQLLSSILTVKEADWAKSLAKIIADGLLAGARRVNKEVKYDLAFDLDTTEIREYLSEWGARLVRNINDTTRRRVRGILTDGVEKRQSYREIAKRLRELYKGFGAPVPQRHLRDRAELIAVTEIGNAYSEGQLRQGRRIINAGIQMEKGWLTVGDDRVEEVCIANQAAGWIDHNATFPDGSSAPTAHPGCRCSLTMRRKRV